MAGIVDISPRPLPYSYTADKSFFSIFLRKLARFRKRFWMKYIYSKSFHSLEEVVDKLASFTEDNSQSLLYFVTYPFVDDYLDFNLPGSNFEINLFNDKVRNLSLKNSNFNVIDFNKVSSGDEKNKYISILDDSHLNELGNKTIYNMIKEELYSQI